MATVASQGVTFKVGDGGGPEVFNTVGEVTTISGLRGGSAQVIDVSTLASTRREKIMGLPDEGQITVGLNYDPADSQQGVAGDRAQQPRADQLPDRTERFGARPCSASAATCCRSRWMPASTPS